MRILGVDYGSKRIGLAISDETETLAQAIGYVTGGISDILATAATRNAQKVVVGVPVRLNNTNSPQTERTLRFIEALQKTTRLPVERWDERLTTAQAERVLIEGNVRRRARKEKIDQLAAQLMLQSYLDAKQEIRNPNLEPRNKSE